MSGTDLSPLYTLADGLVRTCICPLADGQMCFANLYDYNFFISVVQDFPRSVSTVAKARNCYRICHIVQCSPISCNKFGSTFKYGNFCDIVTERELLKKQNTIIDRG